MAPPKPTPIAAPRRGKFLSPPSSSPSSSAAPPASTTTPAAPSTSPSGTAKTRGKFLGKKPSPSPSSLQAVSSSGGGNADADSRENLRVHIRTAKIAAVTRRKAIATERDRVMNDLDEAENIVLSLLECASDLSGKLSQMTTAKSKKRQGEKQKQEEGDKSTGGEEETFEQLTAEVRENNVGYLAGVKTLHKLLAPHASLVKSYTNLMEGIPPPSSTATSVAVTSSQSSSIPSKIVEEATSNMYAARVKKRLAMEKSEILSEMIRLEELEGSTTNTGSGASMDTESAGSKRKHESVE